MGLQPLSVAALSVGTDLEAVAYLEAAAVLRFLIRRLCLRRSSTSSMASRLGKGSLRLPRFLGKSSPLHEPAQHPFQATSCWCYFGICEDLDRDVMACAVMGNACTCQDYMCPSVFRGCTGRVARSHPAEEGGYKVDIIPGVASAFGTPSQTTRQEPCVMW